MSISPATLRSDTTLTEEARPEGIGREACDSLAQLFGTEFTLLDGTSGEVLEVAADGPGGDLDRWAELCREVARRGRPEFIEEEDPFLVLAVPLECSDDRRRVAVGTFLTRPVAVDEDLSGAARTLGLEPEGAADWARLQTPWPPEALRRMGTAAVVYRAGQQRVAKLEREARDLSAHLASTYEEISLLHRLTQNLKISSGDEDLGRAALEWLGDVLPVQGLAIQLVPVAEEDESLTQQARTEPVLLTFGQCELDTGQFDRLIEHLGLHDANRPAVVNRPATDEDSWPYPEIRQMVAVPLVEGQNLFGWLAAFNHVEDEEFGTVEASLLGSVGAILGIHSGNIELYRQHSELLAGIVRALTSAIDAKDRYTCGHSDRVARVSVRLAQQLGCDDKTVNTIYLSGMLHDIGKIGISDNVLQKPGKLTNAEYEHIKTHVDIGHRILLDLKKLDDVLPVVLHHHESWDGDGYPHNLTSDEIPLSARIVAVADAFDAMSSDRPYRKGMPDEKIDAIFHAGAGKQWDPEVVDAFFSARDDIREISHRQHEDVHVDL